MTACSPPQVGSHKIKHGLYGTPTYVSWKAMKERCSRVSNPCFRDYIERGIKVCDRWQSFEAFFEDMGISPPGTSLDRIDNNGNYEPRNCRWADQYTQQGNRRICFYVLLDGGRVHKAEAARRMGVTPATVVRMVKRGELQRV